MWFEIELAGLDFGEIEDFLDQREQRLAGRLHGLRVGDLFGLQRGVEQEPGHAENAVERGADLMADHREEAALGAIGAFRLAKLPVAVGKLFDTLLEPRHLGGKVAVAAHEERDDADCRNENGSRDRGGRRPIEAGEGLLGRRPGERSDRAPASRPRCVPRSPMRADRSLSGARLHCPLKPSTPALSGVESAGGIFQFPCRNQGVGGVIAARVDEALTRLDQFDRS